MYGKYKIRNDEMTDGLFEYLENFNISVEFELGIIIILFKNGKEKYILYYSFIGFYLSSIE
jgi:hypothetical protein